MTIALVVVAVLAIGLVVLAAVAFDRRGRRAPRSPVAGRRRILFRFVAQALSPRALDAALRLARAEEATLVPVFLARVPLRLPLDAPLPRQSEIAIPLQEAIEQRAMAFDIAVDARIERGRTHRHALRQTIADERFDRIVVAAAAHGSPGFAPDDVAWLLANTPGEIVVPRPSADEQIRPPAPRVRQLVAGGRPRRKTTTHVDRSWLAALAVLPRPRGLTTTEWALRPHWRPLSVFRARRRSFGPPRRSGARPKVSSGHAEQCGFTPRRSECASRVPQRSANRSRWLRGALPPRRRRGSGHGAVRQGCDRIPVEPTLAAVRGLPSRGTRRDELTNPVAAAPQRVSLFITCLGDTLFPETGKATMAVLERLGLTVDFPLEQTCCGQMHFNTGYADEIVPLVRRFVRAFGESELVVSPSASCVGMVRDYYPQVAERSGDRGLQSEVDAIGPRVIDLTELLVDRLGLEDVGAYFPHRVTYHPTCHSLRMLMVGDKPLRLLRAVRGLELIELPEAKECCGFGGTFAIKNADTSIAMLTDKIRTILDTGAEICAAADNSCLMHIGGGLSRQRAGVRTMHLAEILATTEERGHSR